MRKKKIALIPYWKADLKNEFFKTEPRGHGVASKNYHLKKHIESLGFEINTIDYYMEDLSSVDAFLCHDYNYHLVGEFIGKLPLIPEKLYLIIYEPPAILPFIWDYLPKIKGWFQHILTYDDNLVDNQKIFSYRYPIDILSTKHPVPFNQKKMLSLICANKVSVVEETLTHTRLNAIRYFEKELGKDFDLWGTGWNSPPFVFGELERKVSSCDPSLIYVNPPCFQGPTDDKSRTLSHYKFSLVFENTAKAGYISEKIFDCMAAKTVPVYLGAPNVENYIPQECFVDYRDFPTLQQLHHFLINMDSAQYQTMINSGQAYLESTRFSDTFSPQAFNKNITQFLSPLLHNKKIQL